MRVIEVFADVACPFTHMGLRRLAAERDARGRRDVIIHVRAWPLELVNGQPFDPEFLATEITAMRASVAPDLFVGFDPATFPRTTLLALGLSAAAYRRDYSTGEHVALALRDELFERGTDISSPSALATIAQRFEMVVPDLAEERDAIIADWNDGRSRGVVGSPYFFVAGEGFFCPTLTINHDDSGFKVAIDEPALAAFLAVCFA